MRRTLARSPQSWCRDGRGTRASASA